jgi:DNA-binding GntR family transcriptional regulator
MGAGDEEVEGSLSEIRNVIQTSSLNHKIRAERTDVPIDTSTLSDKVYQFLADKILEGEISYGERLNIREIADLLNVSTMPVREALRRLSLENVVTIKPRSNCVVKIPTRRSMLEAFEAREMIEEHAVSKIYPIITAARLGNLRGYLEHMTANPPASNEDQCMRTYAKYDQLFHQELVVLTENTYLLQIYRTNMLHLNIALTFKAGVQPNMNQVHRDHAEIVNRLQENSPKAVEVLSRHLKQCRKNMIQGELFNSLE